jgi:hypothetical protein
MIIEYSHYQGQKTRDFLEYSLPWFMASGEKALDVCAITKTRSHENSQQQKAPSLQHQKVFN